MLLLHQLLLLLLPPPLHHIIHNPQHAHNGKHTAEHDELEVGHAVEGLGVKQNKVCLEQMHVIRRMSFVTRHTSYVTRHHLPNQKP